MKKACKDGVLSRCKGGDAAVPSEIREMIDLAQTCIDERKKRDGLYNQAAERARKADRVPPKLRQEMVDYILHDDGDHDASITQTQAMLDDCKEKLKAARTKKAGKKTKPTQADIAKVQKINARVEEHVSIRQATQRPIRVETRLQMPT